MIELLELADRIEKGVPLTPELDLPLFHGSSIGGARPKALIQEQGKKYIAKFSASSDLYNVVKAEFIAMRLAALVGLNVARVKLTKVAHMSKAQAHRIFESMIAVIEQHWDDVCDACELSEVDRRFLWKRQFLNPFSIQR